ncbi:ComEC/Rec2 family competence protein, partial [Georgenia sp. 10Sc9-8]|nr:ComEC/Rec2 family competence protein [Georgenia halotolerans]
PTAGTSGTSGAVRWRVLWPTAQAVGTFRGPSAVNDLSVAVHLSTSALDVVALGDLEVDGQAGLRRRLRAEPVEGIDVVVMAHHGSARQDTALATAVGGRLVLVAVGEGNDYGHPAPSALTLYGRG